MLFFFDYIPQLNRLKDRLKSLRDLTKKVFPDNQELLTKIPHPNMIDINNLGNGGVVTSDTCNAAKKVLQMLVNKTIEGEVYEQHCCHHLRNIWINGILKAINRHLKGSLEESLHLIPRIYRVTVDLNGIILAYHKEFSLLCNYPKGHGELFCDWMKKHYPGFYLFRSERVNGSRQDVVAMGSVSIYWN